MDIRMILDLLRGRSQRPDVWNDSSGDPDLIRGEFDPTAFYKILNRWFSGNTDLFSGYKNPDYPNADPSMASADLTGLPPNDKQLFGGGGGVSSIANTGVNRYKTITPTQQKAPAAGPSEQMGPPALAQKEVPKINLASINGPGGYIRDQRGNEYGVQEFDPTQYNYYDKNQYARQAAIDKLMEALKGRDTWRTNGTAYWREDVVDPRQAQVAIEALKALGADTQLDRAGYSQQWAMQQPGEGYEKMGYQALGFGADPSTLWSMPGRMAMAESQGSRELNLANQRVNQERVETGGQNLRAALQGYLSQLEQLSTFDVAGYSKATGMKEEDVLKEVLARRMMFEQRINDVLKRLMGDQPAQQAQGGGANPLAGVFGGGR